MWQGRIWDSGVHREVMQWQSLAGVSLGGNAPFVNVPATGALRRDYAWRPIGQRDWKQDGETSPE